MSKSAQLATLRGVLGLPATNSNRFVSPGAGQLLASVVPAIAGLYLVEIWAGYSEGAPAAAEVANVNLTISPGGVVWRLPLPATLNRLDYFAIAITLTAATSLFLATIGAGTVGVGYLSAIAATRIG